VRLIRLQGKKKLKREEIVRFVRSQGKLKLMTFLRRNTV